MTKHYLIDTDVIVDYLRGYVSASRFLEKILVTSVIYLSAVTVAELYAGVREGAEREMLERFLRAFEVVSLDSDIACQGGLYRRDYNKSHGVGLADALIAATADSCNAKLVTLNKKHFPMVKNVFVPYVK